MEFICTSDKELSNDQIQILIQKGIRINHIALFNNLYVLVSDSLKKITELNFFKTARKSDTFHLAARPDVFFNPNVPREGLRKTQNYGWSMKVAVIDSGVKKKYCDRLNERESRDFTGMNNAIINDHGTFVAKIISYYALCAQIVSMKITHTGEDIDEGLIIHALDCAIEIDADVINLSLEKHRPGCNGNCELCDYVNAVCESGKTVVTVAGNYGFFDGNTIGCPGKSEKAITVGAVTPDNFLSESSGKGVPGFLKPNLLAPGHVNVLLGNNYKDRSGTSFAAPIISGLLTALIPSFGIDSILTHIYDTCTDLGYDKHEQGFGLLNIDRLMEVCDNEQAISTPSSG